MHEISPGVGLVGREDMRRKLEELFMERGGHFTSSRRRASS